MTFFVFSLFTKIREENASHCSLTPTDVPGQKDMPKEKERR